MYDAGPKCLHHNDLMGDLVNITQAVFTSRDLSGTSVGCVDLGDEGIFFFFKIPAWKEFEHMTASLAGRQADTLACVPPPPLPDRKCDRKT